MTAASADNGPAAPKIESHTSFLAALGWGFHNAIAQGARRIVCVDGDFALWPLDDASLHQALAAWLRLPQRQLTFLARDYGLVPQRFARFMTWRRDWAHAIQYLQAPQELAADLPNALVSDGKVSVQLMDAEHWRGRAQLDSRSAHLLRERIDVVLQRSELTFAVNTLGL
jgi:hypothetical protein